MALEALVYPQTQDPFCYGINKDFYNNHVTKQQEQEQEQEQRSFSFVENQTVTDFSPTHLNETSAEPSRNNKNTQKTKRALETNRDLRPKRRKVRSRKNKEEIENQRMTHIAVERNRRKQMNEYLSVLRSIMPDSYIQRSDQASIIGGAINFVKDLEQKFHFFGAKKEAEIKSDDAGESKRKPFSEFFSFPQYSTSGEIQSCIADIEVTMVENHANLKVRSEKRPKQLLKIVSGLHNMHLTILHLNVTTADEIVLYSLSVKVEDDCKLGSVDDIAAAIYNMMNMIQQEQC